MSCLLDHIFRPSVIILSVLQVHSRISTWQSFACNFLIRTAEQTGAVSSFALPVSVALTCSPSQAASLKTVDGCSSSTPADAAPGKLSLKGRIPSLLKCSANSVWVFFLSLKCSLRWGRPPEIIQVVGVVRLRSRQQQLCERISLIY